MRLSGLVITAVLLLSISVPATSSSGGSSSSGGGHSGGVSSGSSSHVSSMSSHSTGTVSSTVRTNSAKAPSTNAKPESKGVFSFLHHQKPTPALRTQSVLPKSCKIGQICRRVCQRTAFGGGATDCSVAYGQYWASDCRAVAAQLEAQRRRTQDHADAGENLLYQKLLEQYQQCLSRSHFGVYSFDEASLFDPLF